jgi:hypothetical protein
MSVKDNFGKLKAQVEKADRTVKAAAEQSQEEIQAKVDEARRDADERAAELRAKSNENVRAEKSQWREMQADLNNHIERVRQRMDAKKAAVDADVADSDADWAEADAEDAIAFALSAIVEAEYATLDAMLARENMGERRYGGITVGGIIVILGIILIIVWSFWIGLIVALIGLIAFGGFARGKWY